MFSPWNEKKVLAIGDSITAPGVWQREMDAVLGTVTSTHAYGGIGLVAMVDGMDGWQNDQNLLPPLTEADVADKDLILLFGGHNERETPYGSPGDLWPAQDTLMGKFQYVIERIYALLSAADNLTCRFALISPFCVGSYDWIETDGYGEYPAGSGMSLERMALKTVEIAGANNIPCYDAWHNSGINRFTRNKFAINPNPLNPDYDPAKTYDAPYPWRADQAHLNEQYGYPFLGRRIAGFVLTI